MKKLPQSLKPLSWRLLVTAAFFLLLLACLVPVWAYDSLVLRHQRAFQRWDQRQPNHYRYEITLSSSLLYLRYRVEVYDNQVVQVTNARSGSDVNLTPSPALNYMPGYQAMAVHLRIEDLFRHIRTGTNLPRSPKAVIGRGSPRLYATFVRAGWLSDGWQGCQPAFPEVRYNPVFGYPESLTLFGQPCASSGELTIPMEITIEAFQPLP